VVLEATYGWYWAADTLAAAGAEVHLAHPLGVKAFSYRRVKNDERDAADLADLLRMGRLPEAWIAPPEVRELRELTRYRHKLVSLQTSCKDQVHAVLAKLGIPVTCSDLFGVAGSAWLDALGLPQPYAGKVTSLRQLAFPMPTAVEKPDQDWVPGPQVDHAAMNQAVASNRMRHQVIDLDSFLSFFRCCAAFFSITSLSIHANEGSDVRPRWSRPRSSRDQSLPALSRNSTFSGTRLCGNVITVICDLRVS
jgi:hypothetical protein